MIYRVQFQGLKSYAVMLLYLFVEWDSQLTGAKAS